ncbi:MAG: hypothetical protein R3Y38_03405 [Rikenellaceae bacterium]
MLNSIIKNFFENGTRLVVADFGAFIKKQQTGEVVFTQLLTEDDGVLVGLVKKEYCLSELASRELVKKFVAQLRQQSLVTGSYTISGFGEFELTDSGLFVFHQEGEFPEVKHEKIFEKLQDEEPEIVAELEPETEIESELEQKTGVDKVMIIAVTVTLLAVLIMAYGYFTTKEDVDLTPELKVEQTK